MKVTSFHHEQLTFLALQLQQDESLGEWER